MGTKNNPGKYDCYKAADPDQPMFVLLAGDEIAPSLVCLWAALSNHDFEAAHDFFDLAKAAAEGREKRDFVKTDEAYDCAQSMRDWASRETTDA